MRRQTNNKQNRLTQSQVSCVFCVEANNRSQQSTCPAVPSPSPSALPPPPAALDTINHNWYWSIIDIYTSTLADLSATDQTKQQETICPANKWQLCA